VKSVTDFDLHPLVSSLRGGRRWAPKGNQGPIVAKQTRDRRKEIEMDYICKNKDTEANVGTVRFSDYNSAYAYDPSSVVAEDRVIKRKWSHKDLVSWHENLRREAKNLAEKMGVICADDPGRYEESRDSLCVFGYLPTPEEKIENAIREASVALSKGWLDHAQASILEAKELISLLTD